MTAAVEYAAVDLDAVLEDARSAVAEQDVHRDRFDRLDRVHYLTRLGCSASEIATRVGLSDRHVVRLRSKTVPAAVARRLPYPKSITDERAAEVEALAQRVFEWAGALRDEDPAVVFEGLTRLSRQQLLEFVMVALAMVPSEATLRSALGWVLDLPAAQGVE
ncbi:MAG: hypothetical protein PGN37_20390 [Mycobacterium kyogaense]|uniref:hypothetical protein n=1 Tax=Mycobacterium kyogaense TaxID=2212479 RepID=UPI002FF5F688